MCTLVHPYSFSPYSHKFKVPYQGTAFVIDFGRFFKDLKRLKHLTIMQLINSHPLQRWLSPAHWCCFLKYFLSRNQWVWLKNVKWMWLLFKEIATKLYLLTRSHPSKGLQQSGQEDPFSQLGSASVHPRSWHSFGILCTAAPAPPPTSYVVVGSCFHF